MATRPELVMLQKTMVVVEGVARTLDPKLDIWRTSDPVVREWIERNLGPIGRIEEAAGSLSTLATAVSHLPDLALRAERLVGKLEWAADRGFALHPESVDAIGRAEGRGNVWGTVALWVIAILLLLVLLRAF
jgi:ubiquinone biosynthesis protein